MYVSIYGINEWRLGCGLVGMSGWRTSREWCLTVSSLNCMTDVFDSWLKGGNMRWTCPDRKDPNTGMLGSGVKGNNFTTLKTNVCWIFHFLPLCCAAAGSPIFFLLLMLVWRRRLCMPLFELNMIFCGVSGNISIFQGGLRPPGRERRWVVNLNLKFILNWSQWNMEMLKGHPANEILQHAST